MKRRDRESKTLVELLPGDRERVVALMEAWHMNAGQVVSRLLDEAKA